MTRALVTGASGHIGSNLVHLLAAEDGWEPVPFARVTSDLRAIEPLGLSVRRGDVTDAESVRAGMEGCEVVFHTAAVYRNWTKDPAEMGRVAMEGTRLVLQAAKDAGVRRVVYTSSSNAVGFGGTWDDPPDETVWNDAAQAPYVKAKVAAERAAHALAEELDLEVVYVLPTGVLGRFDYRTTPTTQNFLDMVSGAGPAPFPLNLVDVRDVARVHLAAAEKGRPGRRYLAGGDNVQVDDLVALFDEILGMRPGTSLPPFAVLGAVAFLAEMLSKVTGNEPMLTSAMVRELRPVKALVFDTTRMREELGIIPRSPREIVQETARWAGFMGTIKTTAVVERIASTLPPDPSWPAPA